MPREASGILVAYVTCSGAEEARRIGRALVEERLAACVNFRPHTAIYRWQGVVEEAEEYALLAKTTRARFSALRDRVVALHSYDLPCVVAWPLADGLAEYVDWVADAVAFRPA